MPTHQNIQNSSPVKAKQGLASNISELHKLWFIDLRWTQKNLITGNQPVIPAISVMETSQKATKVKGEVKAWFSFVVKVEFKCNPWTKKVDIDI